MSALRRLAWVALVLAFGQIVFGAIVRITGSGMGCGDSWPQCAGQWLPPLERPDLIIEVTHRYIAAALTLVIIALVLLQSERIRSFAFGRAKSSGTPSGPAAPAVAESTTVSKEVVA